MTLFIFFTFTLLTYSFHIQRLYFFSRGTHGEVLRLIDMIYFEKTDKCVNIRY